MDSGFGDRLRWRKRSFDRQHRTGGPAQDGLGDATQQEPTQPGASVSAEYEEVGLDFLRHPQDVRGRIALFQEVLDTDFGIRRLQLMQLVGEPPLIPLREGGEDDFTVDSGRW